MNANRNKTPALMLQGTCSDAGKSIITTGLCRIFLQDGYRVAPFKAQNMSLNSFVTRDGGEMGRAQVVQAQACRLDPEVRMNPILIKPSSDTGSQIIVNGQPIGNLTVTDYVAYKETARKAAQAAYDSLAAEFDLIVLEGAGSPAEVNLKKHDIVNMGMARHAEAKVIIVGDIDRGGVFASLVGTMELFEEWEKDLVAGYIINKFRGLHELLTPALDFMLEKTGKPVFGVIDYLPELGLPEEDSVGFKQGLFESAPEKGLVTIGIVDLPHISNFTDFEPFLAEPDVGIRIVRKVRDLEGIDALILPGSKNVMHDLAWLRQSGLADAIKRMAPINKTEIIGICGGFQMLGAQIEDPYAIESSKGESLLGLGLLPLTTRLEREKTLIRKNGLHLESGCFIHGYEIHHGQTTGNFTPIHRLDEIDCGAGTEAIWGSYLHGIFDADPFRRWFIDRLRIRKGLRPLTTVQAPYDLEPALDRLAAHLRERLDMTAIYKLLNL